MIKKQEILVDHYMIIAGKIRKLPHLCMKKGKKRVNRTIKLINSLWKIVVLFNLCKSPNRGGRND